ncbi:DUF402 domain-containing protein [Paenibacillus taihuensis]
MTSIVSFIDLDIDLVYRSGKLEVVDEDEFVFIQSKSAILLS